MNKLLNVRVALPAVLFLTIGLRWMVAPEGVATEFGMALDTGLGLSTQIGDLSAFFLTLGLSMLLALLSRRRVWFYPPIMLLGFAALGRVLAWLFHDAALAPQIGVEVIVATLLFPASRRLAEDA